MAVPFTKPPLSYSEQVRQLSDRGLKIPDPARAEFYLQHLNYYRLCAYWLPFEEDHSSHRFRNGATFEDVLNLYVFDREFRLLVLDAIERVEVSVRGQWAYRMAHLHGPHAHLDPALAFDPKHFERNRDGLFKEVERSDELFIRHLRERYSEDLPPIWAVCEVMSLGLLSRWYRNLRPKPTRRAIAEVYHVDDVVLGSWLHHLTVVRNICAHHGRLWNREFTVLPKLPFTKPSELPGQFNPGSRRIYNTLVILLYCLNIVAPGHSWRTQLSALIHRCSIPVDAMGFPEDWRSRELWREN